MIVFTRHALLKLQQRSVKKDLVIKTLEKPERAFPTYGKRIAAFRKFGRLYLKVVFRKEGKNIVVITQYWVEKLK